MKTFVVSDLSRREAVLKIHCNLKVTGMYHELLEGQSSIREAIAKLMTKEGIAVKNSDLFLKRLDDSIVFESLNGILTVYKNIVEVSVKQIII